MTDRYDRQMALPEIGTEGQKRLRRARVLIVGAGGLGTPVSFALAGAGVGNITLVDDDVVSITNLHRQFLYSEDEAGMPKAECAARRLRALNSEVEVTPHVGRFAEANADSLMRGCDIVMDGTDNYETRRLIDAFAARCGIPYVYGAVSDMSGQVSVFGYGDSPRRYAELYPAMPATADSVAAKAVLGPLPGIVGGVMATEALRILAGSSPVLAARLWTFDLRTMQSCTLDF